MQYGPGVVPGGPFIVQDKFKGVTWFLNLTNGLARAMELPFNNGNHESALTADGLTLASPHDETLGPGDPEGGGFYPGSEVSLVGVKSGRSSVLTAMANPLARPKPHGAHGLANGDLIVTAQLANSLLRVTRSLEPAAGAATVYRFAGSACHPPPFGRGNARFQPGYQWLPLHEPWGSLQLGRCLGGGRPAIWRHAGVASGSGRRGNHGHPPRGSLSPADLTIKPWFMLIQPVLK